MLQRMMYFLGGMFCIVIAWYVCTLVVNILTLPPAIAQLALIILSLLALVAVIYLGYRLFTGGPAGPMPPL